MKITIYSVVVHWLRDERSEVVAMHVIKICPDHNLVPREDPGNEVTPIKYGRVENENADLLLLAIFCEHFSVQNLTQQRYVN